MPKPQKEMHVKEMHTGGFHVMRHDGKGGMTEHAAPDLDHVHDHMEEHFGGGKAKKDAGDGEKAGGEGETAESKPGGGQGEGSHEEA